MLDVVFVGYQVALNVVIVVVCRCCIHPLHGNVFMCRNHMVRCLVQVAEWSKGGEDVVLLLSLLLLMWYLLLSVVVVIMRSMAKLVGVWWCCCRELGGRPRAWWLVVMLFCCLAYDEVLCGCLE